jgi:WD40 repeat protein
MAVGSRAAYRNGTSVSAITLFAVARSGALHELPGSLLAHDISSLALGPFSPDGKSIVVWHRKGISLYTVGTNGLGHAESYRPIPGGVGPGGGRFSPDGHLLTVAGSGSARPQHGFFWMFTVAPTGTLTAVSGAPFALDTEAWAFSPDGRYIADVDRSKNWRLELYAVGPTGAPSSAPVSVIRGGQDLHDIAFSPDGKLIALPQYGFMGVSSIWTFSLTASGMVSKVPGDPFPTRPGGWPTSVAFSSNSRLLAATESNSDYTDVYTVQTSGRLRRIAVLHCADVPRGDVGPDDVAFSPSGRLLAVASWATGTVTMFSVH